MMNIEPVTIKIECDDSATLQVIYNVLLEEAAEQDGRVAKILESDYDVVAKPYLMIRTTTELFRLVVSIIEVNRHIFQGVKITRCY